MNKAVFIDRDGTLIKDIPYNINPSLIEVLPGLFKTLALLKKNNFLLIIISNQSGIARGFFSIDELSEMHKAIQQKLDKANIPLDDIFYCPHYPEGKIAPYNIDCDCRKPKPGLIFQAAQKHDIDLSSSWMIGDILNDMEAGNTAGCKTIFINNGNETEWIMSKERTPTCMVKDWSTIAAIILSNNNSLKDE